MVRWAAVLALAQAVSEGGVRNRASVIADGASAAGVPPREPESFREEEDAACRRSRCRGERPNLIVPWELGARHQAGVNDRATVAIELGNLAASLCARVAVGRPCDLLGSHGGPVSCGAPWARYRAVVMKDGSPNVLLEGGEPSEYTDAACAAAGGRACLRGGAEQLPAVLAALGRGQPFTWFWGDAVFNDQYFAVGRAFVEDPGVRAEGGRLGVEWPPCSSVELVPSADVTAVRDASLRALALAPGGYSTFHIRRGDTVGLRTVVPQEAMPDTSVPSMLELARQQIVPKVERGEIPRALLVFTDETDGGYLAELQEGLRGLGLDPRPGDAAVRASAAGADYMFVFSVDRALIALAADRFRCDRSSFGPFGDQLGILRGDASLLEGP